MENKAKGETVLASCAKNGAKGVISKTRGTTNAPMHPHSGGKDNTLFANCEICNPSLRNALPRKAITVPTVDNRKNVIWSLIIAQLICFSPKYVATSGKPTKDVLLNPETSIKVCVLRRERPSQGLSIETNKIDPPKMKTGAANDNNKLLSHCRPGKYLNDVAGRPM